MGRFLQNLKQKTVAGTTGPTSAELQASGQTIFLETRNISDLDELIKVQNAHALQTQNGAGLPHPGLSQIIDTSINDSGVPADVNPVPDDFEILQVCVLAVKNQTGGSASVTIAITDGTSSIPLISGLSVGAGTTSILVSPLAFDGSTSNTNTPFLLDSSLKLMASSDAAVTVQVGFRTLSVK